MQGTKVVKGAVLLVAALATVGTAVAATSIPAGVPTQSLEGIPNALRADGSSKHTAAGHLQIKDRAIDCSKLVASLCAARTGLRGDTGPRRVLPFPVDRRRPWCGRR